MLIDVAGSRVYAYTGTRAFDGAQPTLLFVHGAANDHSVFQLQSRYFAYHGRNVLAVDLPGHGRSEGVALPSVEAIADWLRDVMDAAGVAEASVVGHSMGALASLELAARNPDRVRRLALLGPAAPMTVSDDLLAAAARNDHVAYELITGWSFSSAGQLGGGQVPGVWMLGSAMRLLERSRHGVLSADLIACNRYANGVDAAKAIRCPVLAIVATRDVMAPLRNAQPLLAALPQVTTIRLDDTGHALMAERPGEVLDALRPFA
jgi:pimeloyl-ACP methyl ester carboxylesterase